MQSLTSESRVVERYFGFIDVLGRRLREGGYGVDGAAFGPLVDQLPGLKPLLDSLVVASPTARKVKDRLIEDWNPFAQRILLSDEAPPDATAFELDFTLISTYTQTLVEWGHEAVHILALEPWLCGRREIGSEAELVTWHLASEALAFWYADIVITRKIRETIPEAELVYSRQSVSNTAFHPEQAFRRLGLTEANAILPLYIAAFLGEDTDLNSLDHPFATVLAQRLHDFYCGTTITLQGLHAVLDMFSLFSDFYRRFCAVPGLPSLFGEDEFIANLPLHEYHVLLGTKLLPHLEDVAAERIRRVCARRHVQTRAYYAWFLLGATKRRWVFGNASLDVDAILAGLNAYLDSLEWILRNSVVAEDPTAVMERLKRLDETYATNVKDRLERGQAHVMYRYRLYPYFAPTGGIMGVADQRSNYSPDEMLKVVRFVMERCTWDGELIGRLNRFLTISDAGDAGQIRAAYNDFMTHPLALETWSVRLDDIDPARNQFRELVFEYT